MLNVQMLNQQDQFYYEIYQYVYEIDQLHRLDVEYQSITDKSILIINSIIE